MLKRIVHIVFSVVMALLLVFGGVSKEYLHMFTGHTDTIDHNYGNDGLHLESEHHHCTFLSFTLPPYVDDAAIYELPQPKEVFLHNITVTVSHLIPRAVPVSRLRGPPAIFA
ncbi:MAG: hypothetical protein KDC07_07710 [Chitinophagaceae bacterium]|nr:hypothetical protein [Chitinophagaceae bacterium]MCB9045905.1 hypothetical protein [Chitinophagales bacterium]